MRCLRWVFIKFVGFIDKKHIEDFIKWDNLYRAKRVLDRRMTRVQKIKKDK